jgi:hypothetical protein
VLIASERDRPDVAQRRAEWRVGQGGLDPERLVFIDETWAKTNMTRPWGRAQRGTRLVAKVPHGHWKTTTFLAALRTTGLTAPLVVDGAINGEVFLAYVRQMQGASKGLFLTFAKLKAAEASIDRIIEVIESDQVIQDELNACPLPRRKGVTGSPVRI